MNTGQINLIRIKELCELTTLKKTGAILNEMDRRNPLTEAQTIILNDFVIWCAKNHNHAAVRNGCSYSLKHALQIKNILQYKNKRIDSRFLLGYDFPLFYTHNEQFKLAMFKCDVKIKLSTVNKAYWEFAGGFREVMA